MTIELRDERPGDEDAIRAMTDAAFDGMPFSQGDEGAIVDRLRRAGALAVSLVALEDGVPVGHAAFSPVTIEGEGGRWLGLGPLSVRPGHQRRGIGLALLNEGLNRLRAGGATGCVLVGDPGYYGRFGFRTHPGLTYSDVPQRYVQALQFGTPRAVAGAIHFHPSFHPSSSGDA